MSKAFGLAQLGNAFNDGALSNRNLIINGAMQVAQRGTSFTNATTSWVYSLDRWKFYSEAGVSATINKVSITKDGVSVDALHWQQPSTTGNTYLGQVIEGTYLRGKTVTVSFWVDTVSNVNVLIADSVNFPTPQAVTTGRNTYTVTLASNFNADTAVLYFQSPAGASELKITDVQLEVGDTATPFEHRSYGQELALCQRYLYRMDAGLAIINGGSPNYSDSLFDVYFPVTMRSAPTMLSTGITGYGAGSTQYRIYILNSAGGGFLGAPASTVFYSSYATKNKVRVVAGHAAGWFNSTIDTGGTALDVGSDVKLMWEAEL